MDIFSELVRLRREGRKCALATVVAANGSAPGYEGAKMLVREDGSIAGTIGGGSVEAQVIDEALRVIESGKPRRLAFNLDAGSLDEGNPVCGGSMEVFVEPVLPQPVAFIFGGGHVGKSISQAATLAGFATVIVDDREEFANRSRFPEAEEVFAAPYEEVFPKLPINETSFLIIVTRGHKDDLRVLRLAATSPAKYVAMIGSRRKVTEIVKALENEGLARAALERIYAPMGLAIGAVTPGEIAVSVVAEMIAVRRQASTGWRDLSMSLFNKSRQEGQ